MKQLSPLVLAFSLIAAHPIVHASDHGCALGQQGQRFDLPENDQALAPLRACYSKQIKATPKSTDESLLVKDLMTKSCVTQTSSVLKEYRGTSALGTTPEEETKTVECWARGVARWHRNGSASGSAK